MENLGLEPEEAKAGILGSDNEQGLDDRLGTWPDTLWGLTVQTPEPMKGGLKDG